MTSKKVKLSSSDKKKYDKAMKVSNFNTKLMGPLLGTKKKANSALSSAYGLGPLGNIANGLQDATMDLSQGISTKIINNKNLDGLVPKWYQQAVNDNIKNMSGATKVSKKVNKKQNQKKGQKRVSDKVSQNIDIKSIISKLK